MGKIRNANELVVIRNRIATTIQSVDSTMDVQQGHVIKDIVVDAPGQEFKYAYTLLDYINTIKSLAGITSLLNDESFQEDIQSALDLDSLTDVATLISSDLDDLVSNFGITRTVAVATKYMQRFYRSDNNGGLAVTIPAGTTVKTSGNVVVAEVVASVAQVPTIDASTGLYYVEEVVTVTEGGTGGNVALGTLTILAPTITQASTTSNVTLLRSGTDEETDLELIARTENVRKGRNLFTISGLKGIALGTAEDSTLNFQDALVVSAGDTLMTRAFAGAVDIYVIGKDIRNVEERRTHTGAGDNYTLAYQPVDSVTTVVGSVTGALAYIVNEDTVSGVIGSIRAYTRIQITDGSVGETITIGYKVDQAIIDAQRLIDSDKDFTMPATDILFRQATQVSINMHMEVIYFGTREQSAVISDIESDLAAFFDGGTTSNNQNLSAMELGEDIDKSDVVSIVTAIDDVDRVTLSGANAIIFYKDGVLQTSDPVVVADNEYSRMGTVTFL